MSQRDTFDRILASLHDAMLDDACWPATSALLEAAFGTNGNALFIGEGFGGDAKVHFGRLYHRGEPHTEKLEEYVQNYHPHDERLPRLRQLPDSRVVAVTDLYTEEELKTSPTYNEYLRRHEAQNSLNARMDGPYGTRIVWATGDPTGKDGWRSDQVEMVERLMPHIRQFVRVRQELAGAQALGANLAELLDNTRIGIMQLNRQGRVIEANAQARRLLQRGEGLSDQDGFLRARLPGDTANLERLLARALPTSGSQGAGGSMTIQRLPALPPLTLHVSPIGTGQSDFGAWRVNVLVLIVEPATRTRIDPSLVAAALGLTPTESRVAALLAEGNSVRNIAAEMGRKENSIRWHINRIHRKQGISRQADLVRLVLSVPEFSGFRR